MSGSSGIIGDPKGTREGPSGSSGLFHIHKGYQKCSKWVNWFIHSYTQRGPKMVQVGVIWLIHSYTQRGSEMVQVGHLAYSLIHKGDWRWSSSLLMCSKGPDKSEGHRCFVFLKTWTFCRVFQKWQANPQTRHNGSNCLLLTHLYWEVMGGVGRALMCLLPLLHPLLTHLHLSLQLETVPWKETRSKSSLI